MTAPLPSAPLDRPTVLVVDDDAVTRRAVRRMLEIGPTSLVEAADGEEAIRVVGRDEAHLLDVVLTDLDMPVVTGQELIAVLRHCRPDLPVAAMSAWGSVPERMSGVPLLYKPFSPDELLRTLRPLIRLARRTRVRAQRARTEAASSRASAARQVIIAKSHQAATAELMATLLRLREERRRGRA